MPKEAAPEAALPCIVCGGVLDNILENGGNQPIGGLAFSSPGHYGTTVFDPMDGSVLELNVCDKCLKAAIDEESVVLRGVVK